MIGAPIADADALAALVAAADLVRRFTYKSNAFDGQEFSGVVLDGAELQRYGQDADAEHPAGKSLNIINAIGDMDAGAVEIERRLTAAGFEMPLIEYSTQINRTLAGCHLIQPSSTTKQRATRYAPTATAGVFRA